MEEEMLPRIDISSSSDKVVSYQGEFENFQKIMGLNIKQFESESVGLQKPVEPCSAYQSQLSDAVLDLDEKKREMIKLQTIINKSDAKLVDMKICLKKLQADTRDLADERERLVISEERYCKKLSTMKQTFDDKDGLLKKAKLKITQEVSLLEKCLSLQLVNSTHGGIIFIFTNISRNSPRERFCFELLLSNRIYMITNCHPKLEKIEEMVKLLNKTGDLSGFVSHVRRRFVALAQD
eukprot:GFUD01122272.1.p1 GENE.GFUD01122272.1~~GFUD01122272.1.p1  ORF type:complete len:237 (+),score=56.18 GFUD01122272.1:181-891(+)